MTDTDSKKRLAKAMAEAGIASRRACEELIFAGKVMVNGEVVLTPQTKVSDTDHIRVNNKLIKFVPHKVYFIINKPKGYVCTNAIGNDPRVIDLFAKRRKERLFTVGRLDKNTTGLLIVTNDGDFSNQVIHPSSNIKKEYVAKTKEEITDDHIRALHGGAEVEGKLVKPVLVKKITKTTVRVIVKEGRKREVRTIIENAGLEVLELCRVRIGGLKLDELPLGKWRPLEEDEKALIFN